MLLGVSVAVIVIVIATILFSYDTAVGKNTNNIQPPNNVDDFLLYKKFQEMRKDTDKVN